MSSEKKEHIEGIYNYCDRWCEKCAYTAHCLLFTQESKIQTYEILHNGNVSGIEEILENELDQGEDDNPDADENEIDFPDEEFFESFEEEEDDFIEDPKEIKKTEHPINNLIEEYFSKAQSLIKAIDAKFLFLNRPKELIKDPDIQRVFDNFEIVLWYHTLIGAKINRALFGLHSAGENDDDELKGIHMSDVNGSAKIGIISIKRSTEALNNLHDVLPEFSGEIEEAFILLGRILNMTDELFPGCMKFKRPGFDD